MKDIQTQDDIKLLVDGFYNKVRADTLLAPVFSSRISDEQWPSHLERMYAFWNAILFSEKGFEGNPMQKHLRLPVEEKHFSKWLTFFTETVDSNFRGAKAEEAKKRAESIAQIMLFKVNSLRT